MPGQSVQVDVKHLKLAGRWIEKLDVTGNLDLDHTGIVNHQHQHTIGFIPPEQMTDEMRLHMRRILDLTRSTQPSKMLARVNPINGDNGNEHEDA